MFFNPVNVEVLAMKLANVFVLFEKIALLLFVVLLGYLIITGVFSATGVDHSWPYPHR